MFDPKISSAAAGAAFVLSLLLGLLSGGSFAYALLRAASFAAVFFVLSAVAYWLITQFIPELLGASAPDAADGADAAAGDLGEDGGVLGRRVNLSVGDDQEGDYGGGIAAQGAAGADEVSGGDDVSGGDVPGDLGGIGGVEEPEPFAEREAALDQNTEDGYTGNIGVSPQSAPAKGASPALPSGLLDEVDALPDLESMSDSFISPIVGEEERRDLAGPASSKSPGSSVSLGSGGTFDSRELASAIQTILKRDQKG